ncbi:MAG: hypothetical protein EPN39_10190 [Chitinophagaceae bacterium]|nr:MAG: hypothetical protein EPN39_10190 [Chitinophagaceae bacterium]
MVKPYCFLFFVLIFLLAGCTKGGISLVRVQNLRCEFITNPLGITALHPRLSWELASGANVQRQVAYQIMVSADSMRLVNGKADLWNSGKV